MEITQELLHELFEYKDGNLYWKIQQRGTKGIGSMAGSINGRGYLHTMIDYKFYKNHRLIFLMKHGYLPKIIDHIDSNKLNNRIENLREVTSSQNNWNSKKPVNNTTGIKGVSWNKKQKKWRIQLWIYGKNKHLGYYDDLELAELVVQEARLKYHGDFANHG